ncbi:MAG: ribosome small subunit-dependent GTPase A [Candidatus Hydrogenedentes bacterium]|nr:ribosome small subunit-dependent GTPase A [Candidatus Hydrogenedentota bacterium]
MRLEDLGWDGAWQDNLATGKGHPLVPGRISRVYRSRCTVWTAEGERDAEPAGRLRLEDNQAQHPAVGDWVALFAPPGDGLARIEAILPRRSALSRKVPGERTVEQVLVANVDTVFLVNGLDHDFNPRRIERYLTLAWDSGTSPVIVLNKADAAPDAQAALAEVEAIAFGVPIVLMSALTDGDMSSLMAHLQARKTHALLGSSGVGKSTLVNRLLGRTQMATQHVREDDSRGRHTTTHRELFALDNGALLVDTPGLRELQLWADEEGLLQAFPDIDALAEHCRFRDCRHHDEPGCAVLEAVAMGELPEARLESFHKLEKELAYLERRQDAVANANTKARWKQIHKEIRRMKRQGEL